MHQEQDIKQESLDGLITIQAQQCNILEHIILRRGYNNGSYYGWNDAPMMRLFNNTGTGNDAGIHLRCQGRRSSGYDMGLYVTVFIDLYVPRHQTEMSHQH